MISKKLWQVRRILKRLWFRSTLYCVAGMAVALAAIWLGPLMPEDLTQRFGADSVDAILSIIASSMLAVTTFSLSTLVAATSAAASGATPRATSLLLEDTTAQNALSTFLGAFLFSLVGIIALNTDLYTTGGRFVLFVATLAVVALIVITLLRWVDHLAGLGHMGETISRVERTATATMRAYRADPLLNCRPLSTIPADATPLYHDRVGYLLHLDVEQLNLVATEAGATLYIARRTGTYCDPARPILHVSMDDPKATLTEQSIAALRGGFTLGDRRSFTQDPRFGLIALSEIGSRALSPGVNDPGTAIDVLAALVRVLLARPETADNRHEMLSRIFLAALAEDDLIVSAFRPIARDGATSVEVSMRLMRALDAIIHGEKVGAGAALAHEAALFKQKALSRCLSRLDFEDDRRALDAAAIGPGD